ncbi:hypothetical protein HELRODRAFT_164870 [Helobdella robusta]|uniref:HYR domain-containing protein n=1 Tax=Helobdella robusta TaxID=6412 RepID=T1EVW6_HELRO|nr:hypothetical protein HELRODRAFT_164870 [Helobdella robusta]ESN92764.1 hypothetical protein HELRODRAFT_164870 [Helobdella robusta]
MAKINKKSSFAKHSTGSAHLISVPSVAFSRNDSSLPPYFLTCPPSQQIFFTNSSSSSSPPSYPIWWEPPQLNPTLDDYTTTHLTSNFKPGNPFQAGLHLVNYTTTNQYGLLATCLFNITLTMLGSLPKPIVQELSIRFSGDCPQNVPDFKKNFPRAIAFAFYSWSLCYTSQSASSSSSSYSTYNNKLDLCSLSNFQEVMCLKNETARTKRQTSPSGSGSSGVVTTIDVWNSSYLKNSTDKLKSLISNGDFTVEYNGVEYRAIQMTDTQLPSNNCPSKTMQPQNDFEVLNNFSSFYKYFMPWEMFRPADVVGSDSETVYMNISQ